MRLAAYITALALLGAPPALAQTADDVIYASSAQAQTVMPSPERCITAMSGFPNDDMVARYQFFRLTQELAVDATPEFNQMLKAYGSDDVRADTPILDIIEIVANPVLRQAAPEIVVGAMGHLIDFAQQCRPYVDGQAQSLIAFRPDLENADLVIREDALFLRQILLDSLARQGADSDPVHGLVWNAYSRALVYTRDAIEFEAYADEVGELEALYMTDLDGRLAKSNDVINAEMNRETLDDAIALSDDMNREAKRRQKEQNIFTLIRILGGR